MHWFAVLTTAMVWDSVARDLCPDQSQKGWQNVADEVVGEEVSSSRSVWLDERKKPDPSANVGRGRKHGSPQLKEAFASSAAILQAEQATRQRQNAGAVVEAEAPREVQMMLAESSPLQRRLCYFAKQQIAKPQVAETVNPFDVVLDTSQHVSSWRVKALQAGLGQHKYVQANYTRTAEILLQSASLCWKLTILRLHNMIRHEGFEGLLLMRKRRYDESPFQLRLQEEEPPDQGTDPPKACGKAKVMQSELQFVALLRRKKSTDPEEYDYQEIHGSCPVQLHVVDKTTKECVAETQRSVQDSVILGKDIEDSFEILCDAVCTDAYSSNLAAEKALQSENPQWLKMYSQCLLHKVAAIQSAQFRLVEGHVSGLLSLSLAMQASGTTVVLRDILTRILKQRFRIRYGEPPEQFRDYQDAVHELWLPIEADQDSYLLHARQRTVLSHICNGDLQQEATVDFRTRDEDMTKEMLLPMWLKRAVAALLPHKAPFFNRSKWLGSEKCIRWAGLLCAYHNLLQPLVQQWVAATSNIPANLISHPTSASSSTAAAAGASQQRGWAALADRQVSSAECAGSAQGSSRLENAQEPVAAEVSDLSWADFNKANKRKALAYVCTKPLPVLACMAAVMRQTLRLLCFLVHLASASFAEQQLAHSSKGNPRTHRVLEFFSGKARSTFEAQALQTMTSTLSAVPADGSTDYLRVLAFRMLSVSMCAAQQLVWRLATGSPTVLFRSLLSADYVQEFMKLPPCLYDEITTAVLRLCLNCITV